MNIPRPKLSRQKVIYLDRYQRLSSLDNNDAEHVNNAVINVQHNSGADKNVDKNKNIQETAEENIETCDDLRCWNNIDESADVCETDLSETNDLTNKSEQNENSINGNNYCGHNISKMNQGTNIGSIVESFAERVAEVGLNGSERSMKKTATVDITNEDNSCQTHIEEWNHESFGREFPESWLLPRNDAFSASATALTKNKPLLKIDPYSDSESVVSTEVNRKEYFNKLKEFEKEIRQPGNPPLVGGKRRSSDFHVRYQNNLRNEVRTNNEKLQLQKAFSVNDDRAKDKQTSLIDSKEGQHGGVLANIDPQNGGSNLEAIIQDFLHYFESKRLSLCDTGTNLDKAECGIDMTTLHDRAGMFIQVRLPSP